MRIFRMLGRNIRDSFKGVIRNLSLSFASIACITITLVVVAIAIVLSESVKNFTEGIEKDVTIVVFMNSEVTGEEKDDVLEKILEIQGIDSYTYQSKAEIAEEMMESSEVFKSILSNYSEEENPLQPTYQVKVKNIDDISSIAEKIKVIDHVETVKYGEGMVEKLVSIFELIKKISIIMVIALVVVTAFLITNTIKLTIFSRKTEIEIMRLVGASNINIKIPFILEGLFLGILGSIVPMAVTTYGYAALYKNYDGKFMASFIKLIEPSPFTYKVALILLIIGVVVGMFGSYSAVRKHLKA